MRDQLPSQCDGYVVIEAGRRVAMSKMWLSEHHTTPAGESGALHPDSRPSGRRTFDKLVATSPWQGPLCGSDYVVMEADRRVAIPNMWVS